MVHPRTHQMDRSRLLSRILDPEYAGAPPSSFPSSLRPRSPALADLPQPSVFVDMWGDEHDPDFRPFATYPVVTPAAREHESWPWDADDSPSSASPRRSSTIVSHSSSSYHSSSSGSRSASVPASPIPSPPTLDADRDRPRISPPGKIPRAALFPWTPAQRAARLHQVTKRNFPSPPPPLREEEPETPLTLVDSRYVPGYGHVLPPQTARRAHTTAASAETSTAARIKGRFRSHTVPVSARARAELATEDTESESEERQPQSPTCTRSFRQSVYSLGLRTKLGLYHMKTRVRKASSAALRPLSL